MSLWRLERLFAGLTLAALLCACRTAGPSPTASSLPTISPTATISSGITSYRPECFLEDEWVSCQDDSLGLAFRYPAAWGFLTEANLTSDACGGQSLAYSFDPWYSGPRNGGASQDACLAGADSIRSFTGIPDETSAAEDLLSRCQQALPQALLCQAINERVWLVGLFPDAQTVCQATAGQGTQPYLAVAIDLPAGRPIGGLVLAQVFLSPAEAAGLFAPLGGTSPNRGLCRQEQALQGYQENASELAQRIQDGQADPLTMERVQAIRKLGESVSIAAR